MNFPFFTSFVLLIIFTAFAIHRNKNKEEKNLKSFLERETRANSTRRKPLDHLAYIQIPLGLLPFTENPDDTVLEYQNTIHYLAGQKIVNLTGISNTDLKLTYGAPNITVLTEYDQCFTVLVRTLHDWGMSLLQAGNTIDAKTVWEFAISCQTDISNTYMELANLYQDEENYAGIQQMLQTAEALNSLSKKMIVERLNDKLQFMQSFM